MSSYTDIDKVCCLCGAENKCTTIVSTESEGSPDLDLRPPPLERDTMGAWLQECVSCHYVGVDLERESDGAREIVAAETYQSLISDSNIPEIAKRFALCSLLMGGIDKEISATALLRAAWVCDDEKATELASSFRLQCSNILWKMVPFEDSPEQANTATMLVDVLRRSSQFEKAAKLASQLLKFKSVKRAGRMLAVVKFQLALCEEKSTECREIKDAWDAL